MKNSEIRVRRDCKFVTRDSFIESCKSFAAHFTRNRKMPLSKLILSILSRGGLTLAMDLRKFFKAFKSKLKISKVGYLKQRKKLNPLAFMKLSVFHVTNFYKDSSSVTKLKGYLILAVDGSHVNIPTTPETLKVYGNPSKKNAKPCAQLGISCIYDVINKMIIDCTINRFKFNERKQAEVHIEKLNSILGKKKWIVLFDRGYASIELFLNRLDNNQKFLARLSSAAFKREQQSMRSSDENVEIIFDKTRTNAYRNTSFCVKLKERGSMNLRFVQIKLKSGETEYLATNLSLEEFSSNDIYMLYGSRWGIETVYDTLKNKLELENFTGYKPIIIEQDIYSTIYLSNVIHDVMIDAAKEFNENNQKKYKYEMAINTNIAIGIMKAELIEYILKPKNKKTDFYDKIISEISEHIVPVRKDRQFTRNTNNSTKKHHITKKTSY